MISCFSHVQPCATLWTVAHQAPLSMGFSRQEYWSGVPCPPPGDLPDPGIELESLTSPALAGKFFSTSATWEAPYQLSGFFFHTWPTLRLSPVWVCTFFQDGFQPRGLRWALVSHIMGCCPPSFWPQGASLLPCSKEGKYMTSWSFTQTGFIPSLFLPRLLS